VQASVPKGRQERSQESQAPELWQERVPKAQYPQHFHQRAVLEHHSEQALVRIER
jgi:hypothetical protein